MRSTLRRRHALLVVLAAVLLGCGCGSPGTPLSATPHRRGAAEGPLVVGPGHTWFVTGAGGRHAVLLTGSHTWNNFQDWGLADPPAALDFPGYLDFLERHGHNFIRLYVWEQAAWFPDTPDKVVVAPLPYARTGPGRALDGGPRFDLERFEPGYFSRLRERVAMAGARGIYVSIMLFNGWSIELKGKKSGNPWRGHPFNRENNVNGIDGDVNGDGEGKKVHTLANPAVTALQKAYVRKVVDTVGDLDNVLWEISNESPPGADAWQYEFIRTVQQLESARGKRHPVGMTALWPAPADHNASLFASPADWVSPNDNSKDPYQSDPPRSTARPKLVVSDTDHLWGLGGNPSWVWKSFLRGLHPILMDPYVTTIHNNLPVWPAGQSAATRPTDGEWDGIRKAMGYARAVSERVDLASMRPMDELASTGYCLAAPGREYLIYLPSRGGRLRSLAGRVLGGLAGERVEADLTAASGNLEVAWVDVERGVVIPGAGVTGGRRLTFRAPFAGDALLHLKESPRGA